MAGAVTEPRLVHPRFPEPLSARQRAVKRALDVGLSLVLLVVVGWTIPLGWLAAAVSSRGGGFFVQERIGLHGVPFRLVKLRTMRAAAEPGTSVTTDGDPRVTRVGRILRKTKLDELPQLLNVLRGDMSFVGPRPDVAGFADLLQGEDRLILAVRPGITGPATLRFRDEERLLAAQPDPEAYNRDVLFPAKVRMNLEYVRRYSLRSDLMCLAYTFLPVPRRASSFEP